MAIGSYCSVESCWYGRRICVNDFNAWGRDLLQEWQAYRSARPRDHVLDIQSLKDQMEHWAQHLSYNLMWESDPVRVAECCYQFDQRLSQYKDKIVVELLRGGSV